MASAPTGRPNSNRRKLYSNPSSSSSSKSSSSSSSGSSSGYHYTGSATGAHAAAEAYRQTYQAERNKGSSKSSASRKANAAAAAAGVAASKGGTGTDATAKINGQLINPTLADVKTGETFDADKFSPATYTKKILESPKPSHFTGGGTPYSAGKFMGEGMDRNLQPAARDVLSIGGNTYYLTRYQTGAYEIRDVAGQIRGSGSDNTTATALNRTIADIAQGDRSRTGARLPRESPFYEQESKRELKQPVDFHDRNIDTLNTLRSSGGSTKTKETGFDFSKILQLLESPQSKQNTLYKNATTQISEYETSKAQYESLVSSAKTRGYFQGDKFLISSEADLQLFKNIEASYNRTQKEYTEAKAASDNYNKFINQKSTLPQPIEAFKGLITSNLPKLSDNPFDLNFSADNIKSKLLSPEETRSRLLKGFVVGSAGATTALSSIGRSALPELSSSLLKATIGGGALGLAVQNKDKIFEAVQIPTGIPDWSNQWKNPHGNIGREGGEIPLPDWMSDDPEVIIDPGYHWRGKGENIWDYIEDQKKINKHDPPVQRGPHPYYEGPELLSRGRTIHSPEIEVNEKTSFFAPEITIRETYPSIHTPEITIDPERLHRGRTEILINPEGSFFPSEVVMRKDIFKFADQRLQEIRRDESIGKAVYGTGEAYSPPTIGSGFGGGSVHLPEISGGYIPGTFGNPEIEGMRGIPGSWIHGTNKTRTRPDLESQRRDAEKSKLLKIEQNQLKDFWKPNFLIDSGVSPRPDAKPKHAAIPKIGPAFGGLSLSLTGPATRTISRTRNNTGLDNAAITLPDTLTRPETTNVPETDFELETITPVMPMRFRAEPALPVLPRMRYDFGTPTVKAERRRKNESKGKKTPSKKATKTGWDISNPLPTMAQMLGTPRRKKR